MFFSPQPHHDRLLSVSCAAMRHSTQQSKARTRMSTTKFVAKRAHRTQYISLMSDGGATAPFVVVERTVPSGCVTVVVVDIFGRRLEGWIVRQHASEPSLERAPRCPVMNKIYRTAIRLETIVSRRNTEITRVLWMLRF